MLRTQKWKVRQKKYWYDKVKEKRNKKKKVKLQKSLKAKQYKNSLKEKILMLDKKLSEVIRLKEDCM